MAANADTVLNSIKIADSPKPVDSEGVADLARRAADLNKTIRDLATHPNHRKTLRKFVGPEVATLLGLKVETLYRRLDRHSELPQGLPSNPRRREFALQEVFQLREAFELPAKREPGQPGL